MKYFRLLQIREALMEVYQAINGRHTVREFQDRPVDKDVIARIIGAGLRAPSNNHMREWEFVLVNDKAARLHLIDKVCKHFSGQEVAQILDAWAITDPCAREMYFEGIPRQYEMLLKAGCLIIPCFYQSWPLLSLTELSSLNAFASIWCCLENMLIAAASEGVFGVTRIPLGDEADHIKAVLGIPEGYYIPCYLALGYPAQAAKAVRQHAVKAEDKMHFDKW
jgi:nitroreductase